MLLRRWWSCCLVVVVFATASCGGTTGEQRTEYNEIKATIDSIQWPEDAGEVAGGGYPAGDDSSRPEYGLGANLAPGEEAGVVLNDIVEALDLAEWMVISVDCGRPMVHVMHRETGIKVQVWKSPSQDRVGLSYLDTFPGLQPEIEAPHPICP